MSSYRNREHADAYKELPVRQWHIYVWTQVNPCTNSGMETTNNDPTSTHSYVRDSESGKN